jgi:vancomycin resistance protein YoaR
VRAARELNGAVIPPDGIFSFNRTVRSWSIDNGYVRAPVSFNGELVPAFGGGVCQVSTTLYNAALLSGLEIVERHRHVFVPGYIAAGRDAAVAHPDLDLRIRNPYPVPVAIVAACEGDRILVRLRCSARPAREFALVTEALGRTSSRDILVRRDGGSSRSLHRFRGAPGGRVVTYRTVTEGGREVRRERLSDDTYPAMRGISPLPEALP